MDRKLLPVGRCGGEVEAIASKSHVHRLLIAAALSNQKSVIVSNIISEDMQATIDCLNAIGAGITIEDKNIYVNPISNLLQNEKEEILLNPRESGSTARFILPVASVLCKQFSMVGAGKLPTRPFAPLCECMRKNGAVISSDFIPLEVGGALSAGTYELPGNVSSQYISGLLFALPLLHGDSDIMLTTNLESKAYIDITLDVLKQFGIQIQETVSGFHIPGNQTYVTPGEIKADGDWSNAAPFLCMGAIAGEVKMTGLNLASTQGDKEILSVLEQFGAEVLRGGDSVTVRRKDLKAIRVDVSQIPDLVPVLSIVAGLADGTTVFENAERLRVKESDRIATTKALLSVLGAEMTVAEENGMTNLYIEGIKEYKGGCIDGAGDHRIVMAAAVASVRATKEILIRGPQAVNKSYPGFFEDFDKVKSVERI